ncbi:hypothetical protein L1D32_02760 [Shewanella insulae]|uniref:DUF7822 domain-containing protein n=1 Tax=Shewanella TaxID=22 RepID=UPI001EFCF3BF|nr:MULTISPECIES: hypothetical protein [Shewanella]MCG9737079.1 hypothetical protein [Shewanella insulae]MCL2911298.1 hypothetical protein [Shewanella aquimarina]
MSNRSYLFSSNRKPSDSNSLVLTGLSEWNSEIPLLYKILFSGGKAVECKSLIWDLDEPLALSISYETAIKNICYFNEIVSSVYASDVIKSAIQFLLKDENRGQFLLLEPYEIYLLNDEVEFVQQRDLLAELHLLDVKKTAEDFIQSNHIKNKKNFKSIFNKNSIDCSQFEDSLILLGFNEWSNHLCYAPYPPEEKVDTPSYEYSKIVKFELSNLNSYAWFKSIEINRDSKKVHLVEHRNRREFIALLVDENRDVNDRLNFRFNIEPERKHDLMHVFSLMKGVGKEDVWRLSSSSLENKDGEITLRSVSETEEYSFKENT